MRLLTELQFCPTSSRKKHLQSQVLFSTKSANCGINPPSVDEIALR